MFQSTHLHEVWLWKWATSNYQWCFNPHTYMRCDQLTIYTNQHLTVSIHTPTWGVTQTKWQLTKLLYVSIHTPTWGVTLNNGHIHYQCEVSIHTPTWGVTYHCWYNYKITKVSIHTPTWGVTYYKRCEIMKAIVSIHTPTWGVTYGALLIETKTKFQSTHLHEVWRKRPFRSDKRLCFNPHTYMRCDW